MPPSFRGEDALNFNQSETRIALGDHVFVQSGWNVKSYRGPSKNASYNVSVHLATQFQRRRFKCEKLTDDRHQVMTNAHMAFGQLS